MATPEKKAPEMSEPMSNTKPEKSDFNDSVNYNELPVDSEGTIAERVPWPAWFIVVTELCERFAFYGASLIFQTYLIQELNLPKNQATAINRGFNFLAYFTAVLGAVIADVWLGKFYTILVFSTSYMVGLILLTISATPASIAGGFGLPGFILSTYLFTAFGTGGIKANVSSFVADQVVPGFKPTRTPGIYYDSRKTLEGVFRYFYWAINVGAMLGMLVCPILSKSHYWLAFMLPAILFFVGIAIFVFGRSQYSAKPASPDVLLRVYNCIKYALTHRHIKTNHWLDRAKGVGANWDDQFVDELKTTLRACKVFLFYPFYWALYGNMSDCFISQGLSMRRPHWLGPEQLNLINSLILIVSIPVFDSFLFPWLRRAGYRLGPIMRITVGFAIVTLAFVYVTIIQKVLYSTGPYYDFSDVPPSVKEPVNDMSVWWQVPPYIVIGISEIFASATGLEFAYKQATPELKSVVMSLFLFTNCCGSLIGLMLANWSTDPYFVAVFGGETAVMGVITIAFYWCFRSLDKVAF